MIKAVRKRIAQYRCNKSWKNFIASIEFPRDVISGHLFVYETEDKLSQYFFTYYGSKWSFIGRAVAMGDFLPHRPFEVEPIKFK